MRSIFLIALITFLFLSATILAQDNRKAYATPTIIEYQGQRQFISPAAEVTFSCDPNKELEYNAIGRKIKAAVSDFCF